MKDYYKILGVSASSTKKEIEKSYRNLVLKYHPDRNLNSPASVKKFLEVQEAYEYLKNKKTSFAFKKNKVDDVFDNIFSKFFGDQKKENNSTKVRVRISLEECYKGCEKDVFIDEHSFCEKCQGTGGCEWDSCEKCSGKGFVYEGGVVPIQSCCIFCEGKGSCIKEKCLDCKGNGFIIKSKKKVSIQIPKGIKDDTQIRVPNASFGQDLYVVVSVQKDNYTRRDQDLVSDLYVPYTKLILGGDVVFNLFGKKIDVKIKPRTNPGSSMTLKNKGLCFVENENLKGDLIFNIKLKMPNINKKYKDLLGKLSELEG